MYMMTVVVRFRRAFADTVGYSLVASRE